MRLQVRFLCKAKARISYPDGKAGEPLFGVQPAEFERHILPVCMDMLNSLTPINGLSLPVVQGDSVMPCKWCGCVCVRN